jgi:hypothetical protein
MVLRIQHVLRIFLVTSKIKVIQFFFYVTNHIKYGITFLTWSLRKGIVHKLFQCYVKRYHHPDFSEFHDIISFQGQKCRHVHGTLGFWAKEILFVRYIDNRATLRRIGFLRLCPASFPFFNMEIAWAGVSSQKTPNIICTNDICIELGILEE